MNTLSIQYIITVEGIKVNPHWENQEMPCKRIRVVTGWINANEVADNLIKDLKSVSFRTIHEHYYNNDTKTYSKKPIRSHKI